MAESIAIKENKKRLKRMRNLKLRYLFVCFWGGDYKTKWLKRHKIFGMMGNNVIFQPRTLPNEPELLKIHDNVKVAANVTFYTHDIINMVFSKMDGQSYIPHRSCIEINDNCFIGGASVIVGDVTIGPNAIVAAGSVVTKDVPPGTIVGGCPATVIGDFETLHQKRTCEIGMMKELRTPEQIWNDYYAKRHTN